MIGPVVKSAIRHGGLAKGCMWRWQGGISGGTLPLKMPSPSSIPTGLSSRVIPAFVWAYLLAYAAWATAMLAGAAPRGVLNDFLFLPMYLGAGWLSLQAAAAQTGQPRLARGWRLVGAAWLFSAVGSVSWLLYEIWPLAALDWAGWFVYNLYYPLTLLGLWQFFELPERGDSRIRIGVECLIVAAATLVLAWYFVFRFDEATRALWPFLKRLGMLVLGEVTLMVGITAVLHRPVAGADRRSLTVFGIGVFAAGVADLVYEQSLLVVSAWSNPTGDLLLAFGATLVMLGAWMSLRPKPAVDTGLPGVTIGLTLLPYLAVGVVAALLIFESVKANLGTGPIAGLVIGGAVLLVLVIARLMVALREHRHEAAARAAQDARFRLLVQRSTDAILVVRGAGEIRYASPAFGRMVGLPEADVTGMMVTEFVPADQRERVTGWLRGSGDHALTQWRIGRAGVWLDVEAAATDLTADPVIGGVVVNLRDVTERVRLEAELIQAQKLEVVGRLSSSIAHNFNNLLTIIIGNLQLARLDNGHGGSPDLQAVEATARRGAALSRQLLSLSRPVEVSFRVVDLGALVRAIEPTLRTVLPSSIRMTVTTGTEPTPVMLDDAQAEQILLNLALNARDAMSDGGMLNITVGLEPCRRRVQLAVSDTGAGMSEEILAHAFEPFFTTKSGLGTGLGLSTVRRIATGAGGEVQIASREGAGTTVRMFLPLAADRPKPEAASVSSPVRGTGHVLVVDDEPAVRRVLVRQLTQAGYRVSDAADGVAGLEVLRTASVPIDIVLTDLVMPNMGGEALARHIGREFAGLPVLCMSGTPGLTTGGVEPWSADHIITKPADFEVVAHRIAAALADSTGRVGESRGG